MEDEGAVVEEDERHFLAMENVDVISEDDTGAYPGILFVWLSNR